MDNIAGLAGRCRVVGKEVGAAPATILAVLWTTAQQGNLGVASPTLWATPK